MGKEVGSRIERRLSRESTTGLGFMLETPRGAHQSSSVPDRLGVGQKVLLTSEIHLAKRTPRLIIGDMKKEGEGDRHSSQRCLSQQSP